MTKILKPWGHEELLELNDRYVLKKLFMKAGCRCSLQFHNLKHETFYVLSGKLNFTFGESEDTLQERVLFPGEVYVIPPGLIHRMQGIEDSEYLEASTTELDDVVRLKDDYTR